MKTLQKWLKDKCNKVYNLEELSKLTELWLGNNQLISIPPELGQLSKLEWLSLSNNPLFINKKHTQLIELLDKHKVKYTLACDTLLTDLLL